MSHLFSYTLFEGLLRGVEVMLDFGFSLSSQKSHTLIIFSIKIYSKNVVHIKIASLPCIVNLTEKILAIVLYTLVCRQ